MNYITSDKIAQLKQAADVIEETADGIIYLGFCKPGTISEASAGWSIMQIRESNQGATPNRTTFLWAKGQCSFDLVFDDYNTFDYKFKSF